MHDKVFDEEVLSTKGLRVGKIMFPISKEVRFVLPRRLFLVRDWQWTHPDGQYHGDAATLFKLRKRGWGRKEAVIELDANRLATQTGTDVLLIESEGLRVRLLRTYRPPDWARSGGN